MKNLAKIALVTAGLATMTVFTSCTPGERGAVVGGATGAGIGALAGGSTGALIGGAVGAFAGSEISKNRAWRRNQW
ncbi:MAG: YMGG-like glycine zipper-containing protein [Verrucomicrobiota bacterium]